MKRTIGHGAAMLAAGFMLLMAGTAFAGDTKAVTINNFAFEPAHLVVAPGTTVVWTNQDEEPHTVTGASKDMSFKSAGLDTDETFSFVFGKPGTYKYFCSIHPHMVGEIIVK
ncbi:MAG TPA: cupredoxin family copper-binding protein [Stellaceae bacterium]|nr:cupredoxin family copper-binding protein [Stellaceae bacterium]